jgi:hypothetical protein
MLEHAGGGALAAQIDTSRVAESLVEVEKLAREAAAVLAKGRK